MPAGPYDVRKLSLTSRFLDFSKLVIINNHINHIVSTIIPELLWDFDSSNVLLGLIICPFCIPYCDVFFFCFHFSLLPSSDEETVHISAVFILTYSSKFRSFSLPLETI